MEEVGPKITLTDLQVELFREELTEADWFDAEKTIKKITIQKGTGEKFPRDKSGCLIELDSLSINSCRCLQPRDFPTGFEVELTVGNCDWPLGRVLERVLFTVRADEKCLVCCFLKAKELREGKNETEKCTKCDAQNPPNSETVCCYFQLHLKSFQEQPDITELDDSAKYDRASEHKQIGNELYIKNCPRAAFYRFSKAVKLVVFIYNPQDKEFEKLCKELLCACHLNIAACQLETGLYELVIENCNEALGKNGALLKAYYRRGLAHSHLQEFDKATADFKFILKHEPANAAALKQLTLVQKKLQDLDKYFGQQMKKMFG